MKQTVENYSSTTFGDRRLTKKQIELILSTVNSFPSLSRRELANTICEHFGWQTPSGKNSSQACLNILERMELADLIRLPEKNRSNQRGKKKSITWTSHTDENTEIHEALKALLPIKLLPIIESSECKL